MKFSTTNQSKPCYCKDTKGILGTVSVGQVFISPMLVQTGAEVVPSALHHLSGTVGFAQLRILGHRPEGTKPIQKPNWGQDAAERCFGIAVPQRRPLSGPKRTLLPNHLAPLPRAIAHLQPGQRALTS